MSSAKNKKNIGLLKRVHKFFKKGDTLRGVPILLLSVCERAVFLTGGLLRASVTLFRAVLRGCVVVLIGAYFHEKHSKFL